MYPTKKEILENLPNIDQKTMQIIMNWKKDWLKTKNKSEETKFKEIKKLLTKIAKENNKPVKIKLENNSPSSFYCNNKIVLAKPISIITELHELAHHLFGSSELIACQWSISIFSKIFPNAFNKLIWKGHMLVRSTNKPKAEEKTLIN